MLRLTRSRLATRPTRPRMLVLSQSSKPAKSPVLDGGCSRVPAIRLLRGELKEAITVTGCQRAISRSDGCRVPGDAGTGREQQTWLPQCDGAEVGPQK